MIKWGEVRRHCDEVLRFSLCTWRMHFRTSLWCIWIVALVLWGAVIKYYKYYAVLCSVTCLSHVWLWPHGLACQAPLSTGFSRQDWSGLPWPSPEDLPDPGIEPASFVSPALQADSLPTELSGNLSITTMTWSQALWYHGNHLTSLMAESEKNSGSVNYFSHVWLCDPMDCSLPGSSVSGFSRQEYWGG